MPFARTRLLSSTSGKATPGCSTVRSWPATSVTPRRTTSTRCLTEPRPPAKPHANAGLDAGVSLFGNDFFRSSLRDQAKHRTRPHGDSDVHCTSEVRTLDNPGMTEPRRSGAWRAAHIDHIAVTDRGILVDETGDQHASVKRDDLTILLAAGRSGRTDIILAARAALEAQFLRRRLVGQVHDHPARRAGSDHVRLLALRPRRS